MTGPRTDPPPTPQAVDVLRDLRPQAYGTVSTKRVRDPLVEPLWAGLRVLVAIDGDRVRIVDQDGTQVEDRPLIEAAIAEAVGASTAIIDGYLIKAALYDPAGRMPIEPERQSNGRIITQQLFGRRRNKAKEQAAKDAATLAARTFAQGEAVRFVAVDLPWLESASLLEVPLLERKRQLDGIVVESELVRVSTYIRPPIDRWLGAWRIQGFTDLMFKSANGPYRPGGIRDDWVTAALPER